jgi:hypothetical protein
MMQEYKVMRPFAAAAPISGTQREFRPGEIVVCDKKQSGSVLTIEAANAAYSAYFTVDRSVFEACCEWISRSAGSV